MSRDPRPRLEWDCQWTPEEAAKLEAVSNDLTWLNRARARSLEADRSLMIHACRISKVSWVHRGRVLVDCGMSAETREMAGVR